MVWDFTRWLWKTWFEFKMSRGTCCVGSKTFACSFCFTCGLFLASLLVLSIEDSELIEQISI